MNLAIIGHEAKKFTKETEEKAKFLIRTLVDDWSLGKPVIVSGRCPLGGVDVWAEEIADEYGYKKIIYPPRVNNWSNGYKPRNLQIARKSDIVHVIVIKALPKTYVGMKFKSCYHCNTETHVKSGACWTALKARELGKLAIWHEL